MKLNLKKKELKNLSDDAKLLAPELTPQVAGGELPTVVNCAEPTEFDCRWSLDRYCFPP